MSVWFPVKMCSWDQQFTYLLWNVSWRLIICVQFKKRLVPFGQVLKIGSDLYAFPSSVIPTTPAASRPDNAFVDRNANSILGVIILSIAAKLRSEFYLQPRQQCNPLRVNSFIVTSLQCLNVHRVFIGRWITTTIMNGKFSVTGTYIDCNNLFSTVRSVSNKKPSWSKSSNWLRSLVFDGFSFQVEIMFTLTSEMYLRQNKQIQKRNSNEWQPNDFANEVKSFQFIRLFWATVM